jgi:hypothetical protein
MIHGYTNKDTRKAPLKKNSTKRALLPRKRIAQVNKKKGICSARKDNRQREDRMTGSTLPTLKMAVDEVVSLAWHGQYWP